ncbi:unnamed protein product, partial [Soboliphyme baturini]|uniref:Uncharacterized protein n=1 Tax=Soboliphyme baturini TaxID=241478 RepID=A0A183J8C6_9BILA
MAFLSSQQDVVEELAEIYNFFEAKLTVINKLYRLQGRINLMMEQAEAKEKVLRFADQEPLYVFQEESSASEHGSDNLAEQDQEMWNELEWSEDDTGEQNKVPNDGIISEGEEEDEEDAKEG